MLLIIFNQSSGGAPKKGKGKLAFGRQHVGYWFRQEEYERLQKEVAAKQALMKVAAEAAFAEAWEQRNRTIRARAAMAVLSTML